MEQLEQMIPQDNITVKRGLAGLGLFALAPISKGTYIIEYTGDRITTDEANERGGRYLFDVGKDLVIDGTGREHTARYINHACRPNTDAEHDEETDRIFFRAKRAIKSGEEITCHYGKEYFTDIIKPLGCRCSTCARRRS